MITLSLEIKLRALARETYAKTCINHPHLPSPDTDEGRRKIEGLFKILAAYVGGKEESAK